MKRTKSKCEPEQKWIDLYVIGIGLIEALRSYYDYDLVLPTKLKFLQALDKAKLDLSVVPPFRVENEVLAFRLLEAITHNGCDAYNLLLLHMHCDDAQAWFENHPKTLVRVDDEGLITGAYLPHSGALFIGGWGVEVIKPAMSYYGPTLRSVFRRRVNKRARARLRSAHRRSAAEVR